MWTKPQWDAKRVEIRRKKAVNNESPETLASHERLHLNSVHYDPDVAQEKTSSAKRSSPEREHVPFDRANFQGTGESENNTDRLSSLSLRERKLLPKQSNIANGTSVQNRTRTGPANVTDAGAEQEFEYYWQSYPENGSFITRLSWAFDIVSTFRMTGK